MPDPTMPERLEELAARCEAAEGPDRELDAAIMEAFTDERGCRPLWMLRAKIATGARGTHEAPAFTASLDAALMLVPEGLFPLLDWNGPHCRLRTHHAGQLLDVTGAHSLAATPALALCAASLRAIAQEQSK